MIVIPVWFFFFFFFFFFFCSLRYQVSLNTIYLNLITQKAHITYKRVFEGTDFGVLCSYVVEETGVPEKKKKKKKKKTPQSDTAKRSRAAAMTSQGFIPVLSRSPFAPSLISNQFQACPFSLPKELNKIGRTAYKTHQWSQLMRLWYLSHSQPAKAQASLCIRAVSPASLFAHMKYGSRRRVRPNIRHLAPLDNWLRMRVGRMSLRKKKSTIISWCTMSTMAQW